MSNTNRPGFKRKVFGVPMHPDMHKKLVKLAHSKNQHPTELVRALIQTELEKKV